jgi:hypothetical protein
MYTDFYINTSSLSAIQDDNTFYSDRPFVDFYINTSSLSVLEVTSFSGKGLFYFSGQVTEENVPVDRRIYMYDSSDFSYLGKTTSLNGTYVKTTTTSGSHFLVCLDKIDSASYNDLVIANILPATISGIDYSYNIGFIEKAPGLSALDILEKNPKALNNQSYWIKPPKLPACLYYCDMHLLSGGWTCLAYYKYNYTTVPDFYYYDASAGWYMTPSITQPYGKTYYGSLFFNKERFRYKELYIIFKYSTSSLRGFGVVNSYTTYRGDMVDGQYCDGISVTHNNMASKNHIHTFVTTLEGIDRLDDELSWVGSNYSVFSSNVSTSIYKNLNIYTDDIIEFRFMVMSGYIMLKELKLFIR